ncbi:helix-turn-helix transcriptional regulator [Geodermatophilus marinus]|uniref:helix-turn-helix transcriptional regulator n=1 Tax=Geodermatophilus sp. LHW52908 TaxID=2303986 RepID=UPI000E3B5F60|nr:helix-turn-helix transcriptional regulator [Geodermatophilus sp. LHW52908]RFU18938.1 helix-turn-helix domain-containing protein [Geodermatophilus sp. LHW52908]
MTAPPGLGPALVAWRAGAGLSRLAAARRLGVAHTTLRSWEVDGVCPQPVHLPAVGRALGLDPARLRALAGPDRVRTERTSGGQAASPLCRARLAAGLTTTQVARRVGVAPSTVSRWENGVRTPAPEVRDRLAAALRLRPGEVAALLAGNPPRRSDGARLPGLGALRRRCGLTQRAFRTALGIGATTAHQWEHGRVRVPQDRLAAVAGALGLAVPELVASAARPPRQEPSPAPTPAGLRRAAGLTQRELALHLGVSTRTVGHWEAGSRPVPRAAVRPLCRLLRRPLPTVLAATGVRWPALPHPSAWRPDELPHLLTALREAAGWSAAALGRRLAVPGRVVRRWETGAGHPSPAACQRLELVHGLPRGALTRLLPRSAHRPVRELTGPGGMIPAAVVSSGG